MFLRLVGILVLPSSRTARGNRTLQTSSDPWLLSRAAGGPPGRHQRDLRPRVFKFIVGRGQFLSCRRCRRARRGRLEPSRLSWQAPLLDIWHGEPQHLSPNAGGPPSERMIVRCRLERWLKEVNASNAAASGDRKTPNRCPAAEIRLRWRANVNQPSMQSAGPSHADARRQSTGFVVAGPAAAAGEYGILLERVDLSYTSKPPIAVPNLHSTA
jgi:hypothetical protein